LSALHASTRASSIYIFSYIFFQTILQVSKFSILRSTSEQMPALVFVLGDPNQRHRAVGHHLQEQEDGERVFEALRRNDQENAFKRSLPVLKCFLEKPPGGVA
jgi:hypothetical protein